MLLPVLVMDPMVPGLLLGESENPQEVPRSLGPGLVVSLMDEPEAHSRAHRVDRTCGGRHLLV